MTSVLLGLRLAITPAARVRSGLLLLASTLGALVLLVVLAAGRFELVASTAYRTEMPRLVLAVVLAVSLPCIALLATVGRLSAAIRDRRLANLRLMGLTPTQTRLVAAAETGSAALVGSVTGWLAFLLVRPILVAHPLTARDWDDRFAPSAIDQVLVLLAVPVVVILTALLPTRGSARDALAISRRADRKPPGWWRLAPLLLGVAACSVVLLQGHQPDDTSTNRQVVLFFAGVGLTGLGMVLVLPALVRLLTRATRSLPLGPGARIAVRRLEAQPAGVARVVGALLVGLFLVTGARYVLVAFESTPQYLAAARHIEVEQQIAVDARGRDVPATVSEIERLGDVREVLDLPVLYFGRGGQQAIVATCADLARLGADVTGCRDGEAMWLDEHTPAFMRDNYPRLAEATSITWSDRPGARGGAVVTLPIDLPVVRLGSGWDAGPVYADLVVPPAAVADLPPSARHTLVVLAPPGRDLVDRLDGIGLGMSYPGYEEYDFVATMRSIIWAVAGVVLGVGLLALAIAAIDRAVQRRKELVALRLVGLGPGVLRRAQWLEAAVPVTLGAVLAIGLGALAGATFLTLDESVAMPWTATWRLALAAVVGSAAVAGITVLASAPRLRPEEIRAE